MSAIVDDADFLDRGDFKKTQALIRHFINIESPELRNVADNMIKSIAALDTSALTKDAASAIRCS